MQAPGGPDEDRSSGFEHGGWSFDHGDEDFGQAIAGWFAQADAFLLGRRTYEIFAAHWPRVTEPDNPVATALNTLPKHVASTTLADLDWPGAHLLAGDIPAAVAELKHQPGRELQVHGSGQLARTLIEHDLVDEYRLLIFPLHLGTGHKLFADGLAPAKLRLTDSRVTSAGVILATYVPAGPVTYGSYDLEDEQQPTG